MKQFYAYIEDDKGCKTDISSKIFFADNQEYDSYSSIVISENNFRGKLLTNVFNVVCYGNKLSEIDAPNAVFIDCSHNLLEVVNAPNCRRIWCQNNKYLDKNKINVASECLIETGTLLDKNNYYAYVENEEGWQKELDVDEKGKLNCEYMGLCGELYTNAREIICNNNELNKIFANNTEKICCDNNFITHINAPNCVEISCENNPLLEKSEVVLSPDYREDKIKQYKI